MSSNDDMEARHGRMLAELAEAGMGVARRLSGALADAEDVQELVQLGEAFHSVSRSIRQTIALEFKLRHAPRKPAQPRPEPKPATAPPPERPDAPERIYWNEYERCDWDEPLEALLDADDREAINEAVETSIARIRRNLTKADALLAPRSGRSEAKDRALASPASPARPRTRSALLGSSSSLAPPSLLRSVRDDSGGGTKAPRPPPWRSSG